MSGVKVLAFAVFIAVQAASQDGSKAFSYAAPPEWKANPFALFTAGQAARLDVFQMFPYPVPEDGPSSPPEQAQCRFSDGKTITVNYSTRHVKAADRMQPFRDVWVTVFNDIILVTDESLTTVNGMSFPAGDYTVYVPQNTYPRAFLTVFMKRHKGGEAHVPLSATKLASPAENSAISFEHTGGSCMMHVNSKNWNTQLSVEFREKNADLPVEN